MDEVADKRCATLFPLTFAFFFRVFLFFPYYRENILLRDDGHICLTDFGLAKDFGSDWNDQEGDEDQERATTICGTQEYMSPEMVANKGYGKAADYWSLGCITYEMLNGLPPFSSKKGSKELFRKIMSEKVKMPPGSTAAACKLLKGLLNRNPDARLGAARSKMFEVGGVSGLKQSPFFAKIDWIKLRNRELPPPYALSVDHDEDVQHFHTEFTDMPLPQSVHQMSQEEWKPRRVQSDTFRGFSFVQGDFVLPDRDADELDIYWRSTAEEDAESDSDIASNKAEAKQPPAEPEKKKRPPRKRKKKKKNNNTDTASVGSSIPDLSTTSSVPDLSPVPSVNGDTTATAPVSHMKGAPGEQSLEAAITTTDAHPHQPRHTPASRRSRRPSKVRPLAAAATLLLCFVGSYNHVNVSAFTTPRRSSSSTSHRTSRPSGGRPTNGGSGNSRSSGRNARWVRQRKAGVKVSRGPKPPQWEKEGDILYMSSPKDVSTTSDPNLSMEQARELLRRFERAEDVGKIPKPAHNDTTEEESEPDKPFLWGNLSVGPSWKTRLLHAGYKSPTPIQEEAFQAILSKTRPNVVIASPTGSGKSLAYLLPFFTTLNMSAEQSRSKKANPSSMGAVWIVTPTVELACQIQRAAHQLLPPDGDISVLHVLQSNPNKNADETPQQFPLLSQIHDDKDDSKDFHQPVMVAGTPKLFLQLRKEIKNAMTKRFRGNTEDMDTVDPRLQALARIMSNNLNTVILDEADRLLQTSVASEPTPEKSKSKVRRAIPHTRELLQSLVMDVSYQPRSQQPTPSSSPLQVVCASATVGRSLRRQLMEILRVPSMDKAAVLVTADIRTKKSADGRKAALLPSNLQHAYKFAVTKESDNALSSALLLQGLVDSFDVLDSKPSIVFPGPVGVEKTMEFLSAQGFTDVRGLDSLRQLSDDNNTDNESTDIWKATPIYVIKERLGRGLDLPDTRYVFVLGVPSNGVSYAHIAGRTARMGEKGTAVTIFEPSKAPKLVALADTLGLTLSCLDDKKV
ncbi:MAG: hypothetical protein SGILL_000548 [Bacillariaceae sp.]